MPGMNMSTELDTNVKSCPKVIFLFSGKRKSGKDFATDMLLERIGQDIAVIVKLSAPIKQHWAASCGLDLSKLLDASEYKEKYRQDMIKWGESMRGMDYGYFCKRALDFYKADEKPIWIISDARRKTDLQWFQENYNSVVRTVRVNTATYIREQRGWCFTEGVDDAASECDLDRITTWNWVIENNGSPGDLEESLKPLIRHAHECVRTQ